MENEKRNEISGQELDEKQSEKIRFGFHRALLFLTVGILIGVLAAQNLTEYLPSILPTLMTIFVTLFLFITVLIILLPWLFRKVIYRYTGKDVDIESGLNGKQNKPDRRFNRRENYPRL